MTFNFGSLKSDLQAWMENTSVEITASQATICNMAMMSVSKDLRVKALDVVDTTQTLSANTATLTIPSVGTMLSLRSFSVNTSGTKYKQLRRKTLSFIESYWPDKAVTGVPKYYCDYDGNTWIIVPTPAIMTATRLFYRKQFAQLSADSDTNWLITNHYDFALTACLLEASRFVMDDRQNGLLDINSRQYVRLLSSLNEMEKRMERDGYREVNKDSENAPGTPQQG